MEKNIEITLLLQTYGNLLTDKQKNITNDYYNNDLSLSEIAQNNNITRQAIKDNINKVEKKLYELEGKLNFMQKSRNQEEQIYKILSEITKIQINFSDKKVNKLLENVKKELNVLV